jgi:hypothetical protein
MTRRKDESENESEAIFPMHAVSDLSRSGATLGKKVRFPSLFAVTDFFGTKRKRAVSKLATVREAMAASELPAAGGHA